MNYTHVIAIIAVAIAIFVLFVLIGNYIVYQNLATIKSVSFKITLASMVLLFTSPALILGIPFLIIYRHIINTILSDQYGCEYGGLLEGRDSVYNLENENPVHLLFMIKYDSKTPTFYNIVKDKLHKVLKQKGNSNPKIYGAIRRYMGYSYIVQNEIKFQDCFQQLQTVTTPMSKDDLLQLLSNYTNVPLPKNRQGFWDVFVGTQSVKWTVGIDGNNHYPILFRMNHSFADGRHIIEGILDLFADKRDVKEGCCCPPAANVIEPSPRSNRSILSSCVNFGMNIIFCIRKLGITGLSPSVSLVNALLADHSNILHGPRPNYKKHLFLNTEHSPYYVQLVKRIKNKIAGCTFEDVFVAAIAASFTEYFHKNTDHIPKYISSEVPAVPIRIIRPEKPNFGEIFCRNRLTYAVRKLPTNVDLETPNAALEILLKVTKQGASIRRSLEHEINYFILSVICHLVPARILRPFFDVVHNNTVLITNVPGPSFLTVMGGYALQDIGSWTATRGYTSVGFAILTYDNRLELSMIVDTAVIEERGDVQSLLDGVYKYLHLLDQQTMDIGSDTNKQ